MSPPDAFVTRPSARDHLQRLIQPARDDVVFGICTVIETFGAPAAYPLLLAFLERGIRDAEWRDISAVLESCIVRHAICFAGKAIDGRAFLSLTRDLRDGRPSASHLRALLLAADADLWPDDALFCKAWLREPLGALLSQEQLIHLLVRLNGVLATEAGPPPAPALERIMPPHWQMHWSLPGGLQGKDSRELQSALPSDPDAAASRMRDVAVQMLGNLTILSSALSPAQSNQPWNQKRPEMMKHSFLPINQGLWHLADWDEAAILRRGEELFAVAARIWAR